MEIIKEYGLNPIHELEYNGYETTGTKKMVIIFLLLRIQKMDLNFM